MKRNKIYNYIYGAVNLLSFAVTIYLIVISVQTHNNLALFGWVCVMLAEMRLALNGLDSYLSSLIDDEDDEIASKEEADVFVEELLKSKFATHDKE